MKQDKTIEKCFLIDTNRELVVEPEVCSIEYDSDDTVDINNDDGFYRVILHTYCCNCGADVNISFPIYPESISESEERFGKPLRCSNCNVLQIKKIKFYVRKL